MKKTFTTLLLSFFILMGLNLTSSSGKDEPQPIANDQTESEIAFHQMMDVLTHPRCVNCHPAGNQPLQGDDQHPHYFGVSRGKENHGTVALNCQTCHQTENNNISGVPGAPEWSLAPPSMAWMGKNRFEIAALMMDPTTNGNRSAEDIMHHLTEHPLVLWAWEPGMDAEGNLRETPPVSKDEYIQSVKIWIKSGAKIPTQN